MNNNNSIIIILLLVILVGGFLYYQHDKNTATIDLPGDKKIEIER